MSAGTSYTFEHITPADDGEMAAIIRKNLENYRLDIPGTAYFAPELENLSAFYDRYPGKRAYFVLKSSDGALLGGCGIAEFEQIPDCCELQKLYLADSAKGQGLGRRLMERILSEAVQKGYKNIYLETHSCLKEAVGLYRKYGFSEIDRPSWVFHSSMDRFFLKSLL